jgi:hypothetical protein
MLSAAVTDTQTLISSTINNRTPHWARHVTSILIGLAPVLYMAAMVRVAMRMNKPPDADGVGTKHKVYMLLVLLLCVALQVIPRVVVHVTTLC